MPKLPAKPPVEPDTHPDAWQRFEKAVDVALHTKPMHKPAKARSAGRGGGKRAKPKRDGG